MKALSQVSKDRISTSDSRTRLFPSNSFTTSSHPKNRGRVVDGDDAFTRDIIEKFLRAEQQDGNGKKMFVALEMRHDQCLQKNIKKNLIFETKNQILENRVATKILF